MTWLTSRSGRTLLAQKRNARGDREAQEQQMNPELSYRMAQYHLEDLYRAGERARAARVDARQRRSSALSRTILRVRFGHRRPQTRPQTARPAAI